MDSNSILPIINSGVIFTGLIIIIVVQTIHNKNMKSRIDEVEKMTSVFKDLLNVYKDFPNMFDSFAESVKKEYDRKDITLDNTKKMIEDIHLSFFKFQLKVFSDVIKEKIEKDGMLRKMFENEGKRGKLFEESKKKYKNPEED